MEKRALNINMPEGSSFAEVVVREVSSVNELPIKAPIPVNIQGTPGTIAEFLLKRSAFTDQIQPEKCHVLVNREKLSIMLIINESEAYLTGRVVETLEVHPKMKEFGINSEKEWDPNTLGQFFKMNRAFFADINENMKLVSELKNFKVEKL